MVYEDKQALQLLLGYTCLFFLSRKTFISCIIIVFTIATCTIQSYYNNYTWLYSILLLQCLNTVMLYVQVYNVTLCSDHEVSEFYTVFGFEVHA